MAINNTPENNEYLKAKLLKELKSYRNISIKLAALVWAPTFTGHFAFNVIGINPMLLKLDDMLLKSFSFSLVFALVGYCVGSMIGAHLQKTRLAQLENKRIERRRFIEEQVAIRQLKLEGL
ncbi:MAG: hypothetical protein OXU45_00710 [Candidatus Melainabacteria bacterium]|nr:hypothetical protein [Candidatus Melainabacteria bacterium]